MTSPRKSERAETVILPFVVRSEAFCSRSRSHFFRWAYVLRVMGQRVLGLSREQRLVLQGCCESFERYGGSLGPSEMGSEAHLALGRIEETLQGVFNYYAQARGRVFR